MTPNSPESEGSKRLRRPSLFFMILASIALLIFGGAMIHLASLNAPERERQMLREQGKQQNIALAAERAGMTVEDYQRSVNEKTQQREKGIEVSSQLIAAIDARDDANIEAAAQAYAVYIDDESRQDAYQRYGSILGRSIEKEYLTGLRAMLEAGIECGFSSKSGSQAYRQAMRAADDVYLKTLIRFPCSLNRTKNKEMFLGLLAKSRYPERIALLPDSEDSNSEQRDEAFVTVAYRGKSQPVLAMLEAGANPNAVGTKRMGSVLYQALRNKMSLVALALIDKGADPIATYNNNQTMLSVAIQFEQIEVMREILRRVPEYVTNRDIGHPAMATALNLENAKLRHQAVELLFENNVAAPEKPYTHYRWLDAAIRHQDATLLNLLLENDVNPRVASGWKTPLGNTKLQLFSNSESVDLKKTQQMIKLLEQHNATDDVLDLLRDERNVAYDPNCTVGRKVDVKPSEQALRFLQKQSQKAGDDTLVGDRFDGQVSPNCSVFVLDCVNQGFGFDDCAYSAPICNEANSSDESLCCTQINRDYIIELRCSGLDVKESISFMGRRY